MKSIAIAFFAVVVAQLPAQAGTLIGSDSRLASFAQDIDRPGMHTRNCEPVGSGLEECTYDVECWEDETVLMSICRKLTINKPEGLDP